ncbi:hypothetical protein [Arthrobacter alpinus]|uniref:hypothetical protein n=1 Tax=Arthrobacter alpinus TaxID=656366 RepID=UPI0012F8CDE9|nr:hypothetical protein [Arthrobacter alpinus]
MRALELLAVKAGRRFWRSVVAGSLTDSWNAQIPQLATVLTAVQREAAIDGASYGATTLAAQGLYRAPQGFVDVNAFAGIGKDGGPIEGMLYSPVAGVKQLIGAGVPLSQALSAGRSLLDRNVRSAVADSGRGAASVDIASRQGVGYVRMLSLPSCKDCVVLAGKFYRWNAGFLRHPNCDCRHIPTTENISENVTTDPYEYFKSLSDTEQDKAFTKAGAQAIRDGGDMFQVVNSRRGMKYAGESMDGSKRGQNVKSAFTSEGTTKRGAFGKSRRLTPEAIYRLNGDNRAAALVDLQKYGYILPGGQQPAGVLRPGGGASISELTAADKRLRDARLQWDTVRDGRNPYGSGPLTPQIAATAETNFRRWLATGGQVFTK